jgi:hypothetical protein
MNSCICHSLNQADGKTGFLYLKKNFQEKNKNLQYTGRTQKNGAVSTVVTVETAPLFCVCPVYIYISL